MKSTIEIRKISITDLATDAIVNAANEGLWAGGGVCGAIFRAAGHDKLQAACNRIGHCPTGSAVITPGFDLKAKYVIHAVGPVWRDGKHREPELLYSAYYKSLELAAQNSCASIGFPLISAGIFGYPVDGAWHEALTACSDFLDKNPNILLDITFAVLDKTILEAGRRALAGSDASRYKIAEREDWNADEMPARHEIFSLQRAFTPQQMSALRRGNIPRQMEDKWFWYMEGETFFAHRSWTGTCIYRIDFRPDNNHVVTVNRDPEQYTCTSITEDKQKLNELLNWWTQDPYDFYNEWLTETMNTLKKAGKIPDKLKINGREVDAVFFHRPAEPHGYLSNWYPAAFDLDGIHYSSSEQYIMYQKCKLLGDEESAADVMATDDPEEQQKIGKHAADYIDKVWEGARQIIAFRGILAKFRQNEELRQKLLKTGEAYLVECAASDKSWACGIRLDDERRFDAGKWSGQNILGFALMEVRNMLRESKE